ALSGPTHAEEVACDMPTCIVSACEDQDIACAVADIFANSYMRVYTNTDVKGVEICGALKNVIALAAGISAGLGYGDNARAGIMTRGLVEIKHLGLKMGCREETFSGLAGMGDLIVTATSEHSRNNRCGKLLGKGVKPDEAIKQVGMVVEGVNAIPAALELASRYNVEVPLVSAVAQILDGADAKEVAQSLMSREKKSELLDPE
nr:NAD(P)H-dependent glycerol-3-phosphate dehydrogenase [Saccharofermentans sp.]